MNPFIRNYYDLFSEDKEVVHKAVYLKKDWMFKRLFFPITFTCTLEDGKEMYYDLYALMDQSIKFQKADFADELFESKEQKDLISKEFDDYFRYAYCYERIPKGLKDTFFVEMDFKKIDQKAYKELVCNFYPCLDKKEDLDLWYEEKNDVDLIKFPMYGEFRKWVFVLSKDNLANDKYYLPIIKKIYYLSDLSEDKIEAVKEIAATLEVEVEEVQVGK